MGWPHEVASGCRFVEGRSCLPLICSIFMPASSARSPSGPHWNGPGFCTANKQVRPVPLGAMLHAKPSAANATVSPAAGWPLVHPAGRGPPAVEEAEEVEMGGVVWLAFGDGVITVCFVQAVSTIRVKARTAGTRRIRSIPLGA